MLSQIPTHLLAGPLGAGKTSLLMSLMRQKPEREHWAILINEFGQIGLDLALLTSEQTDGISLSEIPGGCLCCVNGLPFQVGLGRLLRNAKPDRLFIEASGLGHPAKLLEQLGQSPWVGVLALQPLVMVVDGAALASGAPLADSQQQALPLASLVVCNKADKLSSHAAEALQQRFSTQQLRFTRQGHLDWQHLPQAETELATARVPEATAATELPTLWLENTNWIRSHQLQRAPYSLGWRMSPTQRFSLTQLEHWLTSSQWQRAKGIVNTDQGWKAFNLLPDTKPAWQDSPWRQDNRIELIVADVDNANVLEHSLRQVALSQ